MSKIYLAQVTIFDGMHEHSAYALIKARTQTAAQTIAQTEIDKQEQEDPCEDDERKLGYWSYGDGTTRTELISVEKMSPSEAAVIQRLGLAFFMN